MGFCFVPVNIRQGTTNHASVRGSTGSLSTGTGHKDTYEDGIANGTSTRVPGKYIHTMLSCSPAQVLGSLIVHMSVAIRRFAVRRK